MKKFTLIFLITFISVSLFSQSEKAKRQAQMQVEKMNMVITGIDESLALNSNQITRLERLYADKRMKINALKREGLEKREFFDAAQKIENEYKPAIDAIMNYEQRYAFYNRRRSTEKQ